MTAQIQAAFDAAAALLTKAKAAPDDATAYALSAQAIDTVGAAREQLRITVQVAALQVVIDAANAAAASGKATGVVSVGLGG